MEQNLAAINTIKNHKRYLNPCRHAIPCTSCENARALTKNAIIVKKVDTKGTTLQLINATGPLSKGKKKDKINVTHNDVGSRRKYTLLRFKQLLKLLEILADSPKAVTYLDGIIREAEAEATDVTKWILKKVLMAFDFGSVANSFLTNTHNIWDIC
uniref:Uncharacterized protein n=1 Tax=Glossina austeni TaxID=7395 RepID=A0A1A9UXI3_GLOAU